MEEEKVFYFNYFTALLNGVSWSFVEGYLNIGGSTSEYYKSKLMRDSNYATACLDVHSYLGDKDIEDVFTWLISSVDFGDNADQFVSQYNKRS